MCEEQREYFESKQWNRLYSFRDFKKNEILMNCCISEPIASVGLDRGIKRVSFQWTQQLGIFTFQILLHNFQAKLEDVRIKKKCEKSLTHISFYCSSLASSLENFGHKKSLGRIKFSGSIVLLLPVCKQNSPNGQPNKRQLWMSHYLISCITHHLSPSPKIDNS